MSSQFLQLDRRRILSWAAASGAFFFAHGLPISEGTQKASSSGKGMQAAARIRSLELLSSAPLQSMKDFYHKLLGLALIEQAPGRMTIRAGQTRITFRNSAEEKGAFYHFAFNVPENKLLAARNWQAKRTPLLPIPQNLRDPKFPNDVVNYRHWNAHSVFFFDPAGNVVEYIARHDLNNAAQGDFDSKDILYASEIAFVVDDVEATATKLKEVAGLELYKAASDQFAAVGDEQGLLLVIKRGRVVSFDAPKKKAVSVYSTKVAIRGAQRAKFLVPKFPYEISIEG